MARPYRLQMEDCLYHITSRGDNKKKIYISDYDYEKFLEYLLIAKDKFKFYIYSYCLMGNHYHLFIETPQANLSRIMHYMNTSYTSYYNKKKNKSGHLFQGRYKSLVVDGDSYFLELTRYIHLNPVKAKIVSLPEKYRWSSFNGYMKRKGDGVIDREAIEQYCKINAEKYRKFVLAGIGAKINIFDQSYAGFILGKKEFIKEKLKELKIQIDNKDISYKDSLREEISVEDIVLRVADRYKIEKNIIYSSKKKPILARKLSIYLVKRLSALSNKEIGARFNISYSAVSKAFRNVVKLIKEDKRVGRNVENIISHFKG